MVGQSILTLAEALCRTGIETLPAATGERAQDCILDALGAAVAGRQMQSTAAMEAVVSARALGGQASVWFGGRICDPISAATINAMAGTALDVDDGHRRAAGHPGVAVISAALAVAEERNATLSDLLAATIAGYEAAVRVALARKPEHHTSTVSGRWSGVGAAVAAAWLHGLPPETMAQSILIAEQHAPRASSAKHHGFAGVDVKEAIAWSVFTGLHAVELARNGFTGYPDTFDQGILYDPEVICRNLDRFDAISGLFFKPYACCRWIHAAIDALREIMQVNDLVADDIESVKVRTFDQAVGLGNRIEPENEAQAQFSIPFCLAAVAVRGAMSLIPMDPDLIRDKSVREFARKVSILPDADMNSAFPNLAPAIVEVATAGAFFRSRVDAAFGDPTNPMARSDVQEKFRRLAGGRISPDRINGIVAGLSQFGVHAARPVREVFDGIRETCSGEGTISA